MSLLPHLLFWNRLLVYRFTRPSILFCKIELFIMGEVGNICILMI